MTTSFTCRVCGNVPLVLNEPKPFVEVAEVYYNVTNLQTMDESPLPKFVCQYCYGKLVEIDWFRKTCIASYDKLTTMFPNPYGSADSHEQLNRSAFEIFPHEQSHRHSYSANPIQNMERLGNAISYPHSQSDAGMVPPSLTNTVLASETMELTQTPPKPIDSQSKSRPVAKSDLFNIHNKLDSLSTTLNGHSSILHRIEKFMNTYSFSKAHEHQPLPSSREDLRLRSSENFEEFERMQKIETREQLTELDAKLADPAYEAKFFRYIQSSYNLTGKREGFPFFKTIIRKLITPTVLVSFSWKGNSRMKRGDQTTVIVQDKNTSFKNEFPNIVRFMYRVVNAADFEYTSEDNEKAFSDYLRQKTTEIKRFLQSNGNQRTPSSRKRKKIRATDEGSSTSAGRDQGQDQEIYGVNDTTDGDFSYDEETYSDNGGDDVDIKLEACGSSERD